MTDTPMPPVSPDPWKDVDRLLSAQSDAEIGFMGYVLNTKALDLLNDLHAARAADALRHQQELRAALSTAEATIAADAALLRERLAAEGLRINGVWTDAGVKEMLK